MPPDIEELEVHTGQLALQVNSHIGYISKWQLATKEYEELADAKDLQWEAQFERMDEELSEAHREHQALVESLKGIEGQGQKTAQKVALVEKKLASLQNASVAFNHYINESATLGGSHGIPESALGGPVGPY
ncbi:hypothetical protein BDN67DRAFT_1010837 [Paxillus ammoniavirescens]|nr:hypothetical protein BDN67DRAFT_1010837 [Paxillus ammoniavirescens]